MEITYPFYEQFACIGSPCRHNCCIGWEVDIDRETLKKYDTMPGDLGERIRAKLCRGETAYFRMDEHGRCPMLGADNLCNIQRTMGEGCLSRICRDHPRYRVFLPGRTEIGLGLCCEEAGRLLLGQKAPITLREPEGAVYPPETLRLLQFREKLLKAAQDRSRPLARRMLRIYGLCRIPPEPRSREAWCRVLDALEPLEPAWSEAVGLLRSVKPDYDGFADLMGERMTEYENLLTYFLLRHVLADSGAEKELRGVFAVWSTVMVYALGAARYTESGQFTFEEQTELCRLWSANVEYSAENMDRLLSLWR